MALSNMLFFLQSIFIVSLPTWTRVPNNALDVDPRDHVDVLHVLHAVNNVDHHPLVTHNSCVRQAMNINLKLMPSHLGLNVF